MDQLRDLLRAAVAWEDKKIFDSAEALKSRLDTESPLDLAGTVPASPQNLAQARTRFKRIEAYMRNVRSGHDQALLANLAVDEMAAILSSHGYEVRKGTLSGHKANPESLIERLVRSTIGDSPAVLDIISGPRDSALGRVIGSRGIQTLSKSSGARLTFRYSPTETKGIGGSHIKRFNEGGAENRILLNSAAILDSLGATPSIPLTHEVRHAHLDAREIIGRPTPYAVTFTYSEPSDDINYKNGFSMEELSTYERDVARKRLQAAKTGYKLASRSAKFLAWALRRLKNGKFEPKFLLAKNGTFVGSLEGREVQIAVSLIPPPGMRFEYDHERPIDDPALLSYARPQLERQLKESLRVARAHEKKFKTQLAESDPKTTELR